MKIPSLIALAAIFAAPAGAQTAKFPDRMIRIIVPFAAGGGVDSTARLVANRLQTQLGVSVIVENRAGANGVLGGKAVQTAANDGYTLLFSAATHVLAKQVLSSAPYDPVVDFAPVARVAEAPLMLVIAPQLEVQKLPELLAAAKQTTWTAAIPAAGAPSHLATLLLAKQGNVTFSLVPYKGTQPALVDVAGGHVQLMLDSMISVLPLAKAGRVKPVAITSPKRSPLAPEVPTAQESGLPGLTYASWYGVWAPKGTPAEICERVNALMQETMRDPAIMQRLTAQVLEPVTESIAESRRFIATEITRASELLRSVNYQPE